MKKHYGRFSVTLEDIQYMIKRFAPQGKGHITRKISFCCREVAIKWRGSATDCCKYLIFKSLAQIRSETKISVPVSYRKNVLIITQGGKTVNSLMSA